MDWLELDWSINVFVIEEVEGDGINKIEEWMGIRVE